MIPDLHAKLKAYTESFNAQDFEINSQVIRNSQAYDYLSTQIPLVELPDPELEKIYYFRWWTLRKHWKDTSHGHIMTEFLPMVPWAGAYNSINCPAGHHLREGRWLTDQDGWLKEYIRFWLKGPGDPYRYSMWLASAVEDYLAIHPDDTFLAECLDPLVAWYTRREELSLRTCGLFWSLDDRDGMEYSISGPGLRPTLNAYMYGDARSIARMARKIGRQELAKTYDEKADRLRERIDHLLWDGDFYRTIPCEKDDPTPWTDRPEVPGAHCVRELVGYLPWYFMMPSPDKDKAFTQLTDKDGFDAPWGLTTAEQRHPRFLFEHTHHCLWNGYVWPFATAQTLTALANVLHARRDPGVSKDDYVRMLKTYARMHTLVNDNGEEQPWIDEVMHPYTGVWTCREAKKQRGWPSSSGGYERGKDYNHSTFCDLVLSGLIGITMEDGQVSADPLIPDDWDYFCVTHLTRDNWTILYDRTGERYGMGKGLHIFRA